MLVVKVIFCNVDRIGKSGIEDVQQGAIKRIESSKVLVYSINVLELNCCY